MSSRLVLPPTTAARIRHHAERSYPEECCGILIGPSAAQEQQTARVERLVEAANVAPDERRRRYTIAPELLLAIHREVRASHESIVGFYHSHPDREPSPSAEDRRHAWPGVSYLIVTVEEGEAGALASWRLQGEDFVREEVA